jgi:hypothetical protein
VTGGTELSTLVSSVTPPNVSPGRWHAVTIGR